MMTDALALLLGVVLGALATSILMRPKKVYVPGRHRKSVRYSPASRGYWDGA